ncbi:hypothetical protein ECP02999171_2692 [Escherichia coli P0299917.1]|nr:hypothetical protein ECP02999171_2692 [Escherichia coli P0299917.1]ENC32998.1 hypothetical protein ECP029970676_2468 [Escherichia coli P02997067.6]
MKKGKKVMSTLCICCQRFFYQNPMSYIGKMGYITRGQRAII